MLERTLRLLDETDETLLQVCQGAGVSYHWLTKVKTGVIAEPGVQRVERLHNWLMSKVAA